MNWLFGDRYPAISELLLDIRECCIFHLVEGKPVRLKWSVGPQDISEFIAFVPDPIERRVIEHIGGTDQLSVADLEPEAEDTGRAVKTGAVGIRKADRHEGSMMGAAHPSGYYEGDGEGLKDLAHCGQAALPPHDHDRIIFADIFSGDQAETLRACRSSDQAIFPLHILDNIA